MEILNRMCPPNKLIDAPYGTVCRVDGEYGTEVYIQTSKDEAAPCWKVLGDILNDIFLLEALSNQDFVHDCLAQYEAICEIKS